MAHHLASGETAADNRLLTTAARLIENGIVRCRGMVSRRLDKTQARLHSVGQPAEQSAFRERNRLDPLTITPERAAALEQLWETEKV